MPIDLHIHCFPGLHGLPKTLYDVFPHLFVIYSFSNFLITLFTIAVMKSSVCLYSTFYLLFFHKVKYMFPVKHT